jgi:hypothetical protein
MLRTQELLGLIMKTEIRVLIVGAWGLLTWLIYGLGYVIDNGYISETFHPDLWSIFARSSLLKGDFLLSGLAAACLMAGASIWWKRNK